MAGFQEAFLRASQGIGMDERYLHIVGDKEEEIAETLHHVQGALTAGEQVFMVVGPGYGQRLEGLFTGEVSQRPTVVVLLEPVNPAAMLDLLLRNMDKFRNHLSVVGVEAGLEEGIRVLTFERAA